MIGGALDDEDRERHTRIIVVIMAAGGPWFFTPKLSSLNSPSSR
jgi:hypothetical protein